MKITKYRAKSLMTREYIEGYVVPSEYIIEPGEGVADTVYKFLTVSIGNVKMFSDGKWHVSPVETPIDWDTLEEIKW